jgi:hypothetical protein
MPAEKKDIPNEPQLIVRDSPEGVFRTYSNHINLNWNAFDLRFSFGNTALLVEDGRITVDTKAVITVAWCQAKQIAELLNAVIARYETANGEIKRVQDIKPI